jgi:hypothetical protein
MGSRQAGEREAVEILSRNHPVPVGMSVKMPQQDLHEARLRDVDTNTHLTAMLVPTKFYRQTRLLT